MGTSGRHRWATELSAAYIDTETGMCLPPRPAPPPKPLWTKDPCKPTSATTSGMGCSPQLLQISGTKPGDAE